MKRGIAKLQLILPGLILLGGCASSGPPLPPSLALPAPATDLRALRKGDRVYLAWTEPAKTTDGDTIRHPGPALICRGGENGLRDCGTAVAEVAPSSAAAIAAAKSPTLKPTLNYVDNLPASPQTGPEDKITYAVESLNDHHRGAGLSNQVQVPSLPAVPPPADFKAELTVQGVKISWSCPEAMPQLPNVAHKLRIYRKQEGGQNDDTIAQPNMADCPAPPALDTSLEWEKNYAYRAAVVTVISAPGKSAVEFEGDDTPSVQVFAHDTFPPTVPSGLQAVFSGPGQQPFVDLIWSPDTDADLAGYNVYRREEGGQALKINPELVRTPAYRDVKVQSGKQYFYSVAAVDARGNESAQSEEANELVP